MSRNLLLLALAFLFLSGCGKDSVTYKLEFNTADPSERAELVQASLRVIERRLARIGEDIEEQDVSTRNKETTIALTLESAIGVETLTEELQTPFALSIMGEAAEWDADIVTTGHGGFKQTGITEEHLQQVKAGQEADGKGTVTLHFTDEGRELMQEVFRENVGQFLGLFIRDRLVSKLFVETDELKDDILIRDIPSYELALVFADDVNVGLHVTFSALP